MKFSENMLFIGKLKCEYFCNEITMHEVYTITNWFVRKHKSGDRSILYYVQCMTKMIADDFKSLYPNVFDDSKVHLF